jgi:capsular exopolysaccharide synthesis family protein
MDESQTSIDLRGIFGLLRRHFRLILVTVVTIVAIVGFVSFSLQPIYSSSALILVDPSRKNLLDGDSAAASSSGDSARIDSEVEILRSDNVLLKVVESENLLANRGFVQLPLTSRLLAFLRLAPPQLPSAEQALGEALTTLRRAVTVQRRGLTYLISVEARSPSPDQAARLANAVANAYIGEQLASKVNSTLVARDLLQARISDAQAAIASSERAFDEFIETNIQELENTPGGSQIGEIRAQIAALEEVRNRNDRLANSVRLDLAESDWNSLVSSLGNAALLELQSQREELLAQLQGGGQNANGLDLAAAIADLEDQIRSAATTQTRQLQEEIVDAQGRQTNLRQQLRSMALNSGLSADALTEIYGLQQNAELARQQYQTLLSRLQDLETQANLQVADSRIVSAALPPMTPSFPNRLLLIGLAISASIGIGVALAFLYENFIGGFLSEGQLASVLRARAVVPVPKQRAKNERESLADLMVSAPLSVFAESVRRLRAATQQALRNSGVRETAVIMVSSTAPNEGKTTVALALARSYALSGVSTMLIDCDLRKPSLHRHLGVEPSQGLYEYLADEESDNFTKIIAQDTVSSATLLLGARRSDLPTDQLLTGRAFERLIAAARNSFDVIIIDTPPVGPVVDSLYVAPFADAIVFVTRWASTSQIDAKQAIAALGESKKPEAELVAVLNQQDVTRAAYLRRYGDYYVEAS